MRPFWSMCVCVRVKFWIQRIKYVHTIQNCPLLSHDAINLAHNNSQRIFKAKFLPTLINIVCVCVLCMAGTTYYFRCTDFNIVIMITMSISINMCVPHVDVVGTVFQHLMWKISLYDKLYSAQINFARINLCINVSMNMHLWRGGHT